MKEVITVEEKNAIAELLKSAKSHNEAILAIDKSINHILGTEGDGWINNAVCSVDGDVDVETLLLQMNVCVD